MIKKSRQDFKGKEVFSLPDVQHFLHVRYETARELLESGQIPGEKIGTRWRAHKDDVVGWLRSSQSLNRNL
jgi:excisionase family DNA binding protein